MRFLYTLLLMMILPLVWAGECEPGFWSKHPVSRFVDAGEGIAKDRLTGLLWQRCSEGQFWTNGQCKEFYLQKQLKSWYSWDGAQKYLQGLLSKPEWEGWRLPHVNELQMLVETRCGAPTINDQLFPNTPAAKYWTLDEFAQNPEYAWLVDFATGRVVTELKTTASYHIRLVKGDRWQSPEAEKPDEDIVKRDDGIHDINNPATMALQRFDLATQDFPRDDRGMVDWAKALREGKISPRAELREAGEIAVWDHDIVYKETYSMPHVRFPHKTHSEWLACENCHDAIFATKSYSADISMESIYTGRHCGACHGRVAFSIHHCERCHSVLHENMPSGWWGE